METLEDSISFWTAALSPANDAETHLTKAIARQDYLIYAQLLRALTAKQEPVFSRCMRSQRDMASTLESLVHALSTLQRQRLALEPPPPLKTNAKAKAKAKGRKLIPFPVSALGRPRKIEVEPEPVPALSPFTARRLQRVRGDHSLDLKVAA